MSGKRRPVLTGKWLLAAFMVVLCTAAGQPPAPDLSIYPWLYLRDGRPLDAGEQVVELVAVGDVMLGRGVTREADPLAGVAPWLRTADVVLGNLECVITEEGTPRPGPYRLWAPLSTTDVLRDAGFDVLGLANNHALDSGPVALVETLQRLQEAGIATIGAGSDIEAAAQPLFSEIGELRLALLAFTDVADPEDASQEGGWTPSTWGLERAMTSIATARDQADAVVVSVHWGYEYQLRTDPAQRAAARAMLDAGADLVLGHHPHVVQGSEVNLRGAWQASTVYRDRFVAYSLGNFAFDQQQGETQQGIALRAFFDQQGLRAVQALPVWAGPLPRLMATDEAGSLLSRVQPLEAAQCEPVGTSHRLGFECQALVNPDGEGCRPVDVPQTAHIGPFRAGAIDLTGDGIPEQIRRVGEQVVVSNDGVEAWRSLPEWRVVDLALGDPNDDGRGEVLLALWKAANALDDPTASIQASHPFIVGYRGSRYRVLWGGSAVTDPIHEVELGDLDGDGVEELVVLEGPVDGLHRAITIWRWHGWGFSLMWRSPAGRYRDLTLIPGETGSPLTIGVSTQP